MAINNVILRFFKVFRTFVKIDLPSKQKQKQTTNISFLFIYLVVVIIWIEFLFS